MKGHKPWGGTQMREWTEVFWGVGEGAGMSDLVHAQAGTMKAARGRVIPCGLVILSGAACPWHLLDTPCSPSRAPSSPAGMEEHVFHCFAVLDLQ